MDFSKLFQKAEKNARRQERKVREFDQELEKKRRLQNERIAIERARAKLELKRKIPPPPPASSLPIKNKKETPQNFVIPKKKIEIPAELSADKSSISAKMKQQNQTIVNKQNHLQRIQEDKRGIHFNNKIGRMEKKQTNQNQISKKHSIQPRPNSTGIQQKRPIVQNYEELLKQAAKNDASAVEQLFNDVDSSTKTIPTKKPRIGEEEIGITAGLRLTHSAAKEKEKKLMAMAAKNKAKEIIQKQRSKNAAIVSNASKNASPSINQSRNLAQKNQPQFSKSPISNNQFAQKRPINSQNIMTKSEAIKKLNGAAILDKNLNKSKSSFPSKNKEINENPPKMNKMEKNTSQKPTSSINSLSLPQKRYLPGDIRYKPEQQQQSSSGAAEMPKKPSIPSLAPKNGTNMNEKLKMNSAVTKKNIHQSTGQNKQEKMNLPILTEKKKQTTMEMKRKEEMRNLMPKQRNAMIQSKVRKMSPTEVRTNMERTKPPQSSEYNLAKIKKETFDRLQMFKQREHHRPYHQQLSRGPTANGDRIDSRKFANYSETDEDEEEEEEENEYGDEDDSDLADFIDDSMVDDLQREDLEETLRIINPRYNKKKWLERERQIDERRMDARFKDVEMEERKSAKFGLVEDLIEAKRGSKALS